MSDDDNFQLTGRTLDVEPQLVYEYGTTMTVKRFSADCDVSGPICEIDSAILRSLHGDELEGR